MRRNNLEALDEVLTAMENTKEDRAAEVRKHFHEEIDKYRDQQKDIQGEAKSLEAEVQRTSSRANRFDLGEVLLEIALVVTSITLLTDKRAYWYFGFVLAALGVICAGSGLLMHLRAVRRRYGSHPCSPTSGTKRQSSCLVTEIWSPSLRTTCTCCSERLPTGTTSRPPSAS